MGDLKKLPILRYIKDELQFGILTTHSRLHGSKSYRVPWTFDEEAVEVCRKFTKLKLRLMPYIYEAAVRSNGDVSCPLFQCKAKWWRGIAYTFEFDGLFQRDYI